MVKIKNFLNLVNQLNSNAKFRLIDVDTDEQRYVRWSDFLGNPYEEEDCTIREVDVVNNVVYIYYEKN